MLKYIFQKYWEKSNLRAVIPTQLVGCLVKIELVFRRLESESSPSSDDPIRHMQHTNSNVALLLVAQSSSNKPGIIGWPKEVKDSCQ